MPEMVKLVLAIVAGALAFAGNVPYLCDTYRGRVQPHVYSWFVWSVVSGITLFGQIAKGAGVGAIPAGVSWLFTLSIFIFSLRYGLSHITRTDTYFLLAALVGVVPWIITKDPTLSVVIAVGVDVIAFAPTVRKTWSHPQTESPTLYAANVARHVLALFSLEAYNVATTLHSVVMLIANSAMTLLILLRRRKTPE